MHLCVTKKIISQRYTEKKKRHTEIMEINDLTEKIIGLAIEVHRHLGPGLLESAYKECLFYEIKKTGIHVYRNIERILY